MTQMNKKHNQEWWIILAAAFAACVALAACYKNADCTPVHFYDRAISVALLRGVDASLRVYYYHLLLAVFPAVFAGTYFLCRQYDNWLQRWLPARALKLEKDLLTMVVPLMLAALVIFTLSQEKGYYAVLSILGLVCVVTIMLMTAKALMKKYTPGHCGHLPAYAPATALLCMGWALIFIFWVIGNGKFDFHYHQLGYVLAFWTAGVIAYGWVWKAPLRKKRHVAKVLVLAGLPLVFYPATIPLANELQFSLSKVWMVQPRMIALAVLGTCLLISVMLAIFAGPRDRLPSSRNLVAYGYFPALILAVYLFQNHWQYLYFSNFDLLHTAERLVPTQQLFQFGRWPFVDLWPAHGLDDVFNAFLYSAANGYRGLESLAWPWLSGSLQIAAVYFTLALFISPALGLLLTVLFPVNAIFTTGYLAHSMLLFPMLLLYWTLQKPARGRWFWFWLGLLGISLWRPAFGGAALPAALFILMPYILFGPGRLQWRQILGWAAAVFLAAGGFYTALLLLKGRPVAETFALIQQYMRADGAISGYAEIIRQLDAMALFQYFLLPLVGVAYLLHYLFQWFRPAPVQTKTYAACFLAAISLGMLSRGFTRHGLIELYLPYFFAFLALYSVFHLFPRQRAKAAVVFIAGFMVFLLLVPNYSNLVKTGPWFEFIPWKQKENRVVVLDNSQYQDLANFIDSHLQPQETFIELILAPFLYAFTERELPDTFFLPTLFYASETTQQHHIRRWQKLYAQHKIPIVVFKDAVGIGSDIDDIPNEMRCFHIAEFIYQHYRPLGWVGAYQIWRALDVERDFSQPGTLTHPLAFVPGRMIKTRQCQVAESSRQRLVIKAAGKKAGISGFLDLSGLRRLRQNEYVLVLQCRSSQPGPVQVCFSLGKQPFREEGSIRQDLKAAGPIMTMEFPLPLPVGAGEMALTDIRLEVPDGAVFEITAIGLMERLRYALKPWQAKDLMQDFNLGQLAYVWGTYDEKKAASSTPVQAELLPAPAWLAPGQHLACALAPEVDKSTGNYLHFRIRSQNPAVLTLQYGSSAPALVHFNVQPGKDIKDYLVRISSQWRWMSGAVEQIAVTASAPVRLEQIYLRKGD